jgi:hypothetical protein
MRWSSTEADPALAAAYPPATADDDTLWTPSRALTGMPTAS